jgi:hypothetical protein
MGAIMSKVNAKAAELTGGQYGHGGSGGGQMGGGGMGGGPGQGMGGGGYDFRAGGGGGGGGPQVRRYKLKRAETLVDSV